LSVETLHLEGREGEKIKDTGDFNRTPLAMNTLREGFLDWFLEYLI
jgi:hypothetical protein